MHMTLLSTHDTQQWGGSVVEWSIVTKYPRSRPHHLCLFSEAVWRCTFSGVLSRNFCSVPAKWLVIIDTLIVYLLTFFLTRYTAVGWVYWQVIYRDKISTVNVHPAFHMSCRAMCWMMSQSLSKQLVYFAGFWKVIISIILYNCIHRFVSKIRSLSLVI